MDIYRKGAGKHGNQRARLAGNHRRSLSGQARFLDEDSAVTFADVRREARIIGTAAAKRRAGQKNPSPS